MTRTFTNRNNDKLNKSFIMQNVQRHPGLEPGASALGVPRATIAPETRKVQPRREKCTISTTFIINSPLYMYYSYVSENLNMSFYHDKNSNLE